MGVGFLYYRSRLFQILKIVQTTLWSMKVKTVQLFKCRYCVNARVVFRILYDHVKFFFLYRVLEIAKKLENVR